MANRGANGCLKLFLVVVNLLFLLIGIAILGVGIYLCTGASFGKYSDLLAGMESLRSVRFILIGCGCFVMLVGLCGCVGTCKENRCLLVLYLIFLLLILIVNVTALVLSVVYTGKLKAYVVDHLKDSFKRDYGNSTDPAGLAFTKTVDSLQKEESCCGWTGLGTANFYLSTPWYQLEQKQRPTNPRQFPESCCTQSVLDDESKKEQCVRPKDEAEARNLGYIHAEDCSDKIIALNSRFMHVILGILLVAILLQIICITCSVVIVRQISNSDGGRVV